MPTYVCSVPPETLTGRQKDQIAVAIGQRHSEATGAPPFFVQVEIEESPSKIRYLGGTRADGHVWVRGDIRAGRSEEERQQLMLNIMKDISQIAGVKEQDIWVYLCNLAPTDMVEYGHVLPRPRQEQAWFESLPAELRDYLTSLGVRKETFVL
jgi:phenylpyruvate tautomerase PptA (4-oxalocrotonate tautomerase family)